MKYLAILAFLFAPLFAAAGVPPEKPNTVLIHPGEVIYARFDESGAELRLVNVSKEEDENAQLVLTMRPFDKGRAMQMLSVRSSFKKTMNYKAEMMLPGRNRRQKTSVIPVMAGLISFESWPHPIEELALFGFVLDQ